MYDASPDSYLHLKASWYLTYTCLIFRWRMAKEKSWLLSPGCLREGCENRGGTYTDSKQGLVFVCQGQSHRWYWKEKVKNFYNATDNNMSSDSNWIQTHLMASFAKWFCVRLWTKKLCVWFPFQSFKFWEFAPFPSNGFVDIFIVNKNGSGIMSGIYSEINICVKTPDFRYYSNSRVFF